MNRFLPWLCCFLCLLLGLSAGWWFGYTRPIARNQRQLLQEYQRVGDAFHATDGEMAGFGLRLPEIRDSIQRQDEFAAAMALAALVKLEERDTNKARERLVGVIAIYYNTWHNNGVDTNVVNHIEKYAARYRDLAAAISTNRNTKNKAE
jgi:hypothetical protein